MSMRLPEEELPEFMEPIWLRPLAPEVPADPELLSCDLGVPIPGGGPWPGMAVSALATPKPVSFCEKCNI